MTNIPTMTAKQQFVLLGIARGESDAAIARMMGVNRSAVKQHVTALKRKLEVDSRLDLPMTYALATGKNPWPHPKKDRGTGEVMVEQRTSL